MSPCHDHELTPSTVCTKYSIHRVQYTPGTVYTQYYIHWVVHTPITASSQDRLSTAPSLSLLSHLSVGLVALVSVLSHNYKLTYQLSLSSHRASFAIFHLWIDNLQLLLQSWLIMASKCVTKLAQSGTPSSHHHRLQRSSPNSLVHNLQVHLQTRSFVASMYI